MEGGMKSWPSVYIDSSGVRPAVSPKSYSKLPVVRVAHAVGSTASKRTDSSGTNGKEMPPRFEPPPQQPMTTSGSRSPARSSWRLASWPMTVWWRSTWLSTDPSE
jgi:hypothetical protein